MEKTDANALVGGGIDWNWVYPRIYRCELPKDPKENDIIFLTKEGDWIPELEEYTGEIWVCLKDGEWIRVVSIDEHHLITDQG